MEYVIQTNNLTKKYGKVFALDNVSINVAKGEIYGFIGLNGAGKTTLIRTIAGLIKADLGSYQLMGVDANQLTDQRSKMGVIVETASLYLNLTGFQNMKFQAKLLGIKNNQTIDQLLELVGFIPSDRRKVKNYSLGMKQRLALAMALLGEPQVLILDEPTNGLDPEGIVALRQLLISLNQTLGVTIFISSHILEELEKLATYYGFIHQGRIIKEIKASDLEQENKAETKLVLDRTANLFQLFNRLSIKNYQIFSQHHVSIYDQDLNKNQLLLELIKENYQIERFEYHDSLENYFMKLIRGEYNG